MAEFAGWEENVACALFAKYPAWSERDSGFLDDADNHVQFLTNAMTIAIADMVSVPLMMSVARVVLAKTIERADVRSGSNTSPVNEWPSEFAGGCARESLHKEFVMKRFWHTWLAMVAVATMVSTASAQSGSRYAPEIGSYQSILARAGYGEATSHAGYGQAMQTAPTYGQPSSNCATGDCGGGVMMAQPGYAPAGGNFGHPGGMANQPYGAPMQQQAFQSAQPYQTTPLPTAPAQVNLRQAGPIVPSSSDPVISSFDGPCTGSAPAGGYANYAAPNYATPNYAAPNYAPAVYSPGTAIGGVGAVADRAGRGSGSNLVASVSALAFVRDYEDTRLIARNPSGDLLFTNDADHDTIGGVDFSVASRKRNGNGWEGRYFGLFADTADATLTGAAVSSVGLRGFDRLDYAGNSLDTYYSNGTSQTVSRETDIHNVEFNLLRNGGRFCTRRGRNANFELLGGFRYFQFDEQFTYSTADGATPLDYVLDVENTLLGLQLGSRGEVCFSNRLRGAGTIKTGIFNNNVNTRQRITDPTGAIYATVPSAAGRNFDYGDEKNDVAFLSEIDLGLIYQLSCKARLRVGYRALGIAGVALATDQIPYEFDNTLATESANTNGSLLLHGGYIGTEVCF